MEAILCNNVQVKRFVNTPVPSNTYLLIDSMGGQCLVIDPGSKVQVDVANYIREYGLTLDYIILTHEHFDHCWGVNYLLEKFPAKVVATRLCAEWVQTPMNYFNKLYFDSDEMYSIEKVDFLAEEIGWKLVWQGVNVDLIDAKGHTNRGLCVSIGNALFSGDTMVYNTKPFLKKKYGASIEDLKNTIDRIYTQFDGQTIVYSGHGESFVLRDMKGFYDDYFKAVGLL